MIGQSIATLSHVTPIRIFPLAPKQTKPITTARPQQSTPISVLLAVSVASATLCPFYIHRPPHIHHIMAQGLLKKSKPSTASAKRYGIPLSSQTQARKNQISNE